MSAATASATIFTTLADTIERNVDGTIANTDSEFLHDLRVAVRRTRSALSLLKAGIPGGAFSHFGGEFSWLGKVTGPVRDLDVYLLAIEDYNAALPEHMQGALEPFRSHLVKQHRRESTRLAKALRSTRFTTLMDEWRDFIGRPPALDIAGRKRSGPADQGPGRSTDLENLPNHGKCRPRTG